VARILWIQAEWPARALVKAELEERGCEVLGANSISMALDLATRQGFRPDVIGLDLEGLGVGDALVDRLQFFRGQRPLLLLRSRLYETPASGRLSPSRELARPFTVGQAVEAALGLRPSSHP
jgi:DNA-binding response OmpR family regulator